MRHLPRHPGPGALATAALAALGLVFLRQAYGRMARPQGNDLTLRLRGARALLQGENPYLIPTVQTHGPAPLTVDLLAVPLTWLPEWLAQALWFGASVAALVLALRVLDRVWRASGRAPNPVLGLPFPVRLLAACLALLVPFQSQMALGQTNLLLLWACCLFLEADLAGRAVAAPVALGGAIALKLTPAVFLVALARDRRYGRLLATVAAALGWAVLLPALVSRQVLAFYRNGWLPLLQTRLASPVVFDRRSRFTLAALTVALWPRAAALPGLRAWAAVAALGPVLWVQRRVGADPRARLLVFALYLVLMPLLSPMSETHHLVVLAAPLWLWALRAGEDPTRRPLDLVGGALVLGLHWLGAAHRASPFDALALLVLYGMLFRRALAGEPP